MKLYRVKDWSTLYENNRTRDLKHMAWVPVPNSHDGDGYTALVCRPDGPELFGAWIAILQVASRCGNPAGSCDGRGTLLRGAQKPHDADSISRMTRFPAKVIAKALEVLSSDEVGWLECEEMPMKDQIPQEGAGIPQEGAAIPHLTAKNGREGRKEGTEGTELTGTEGTGGDGAIAPAPAVKVARPTLEAVRLQCAKLGLPEVEAEKFFNHYEANGWRVGRNPMRSWPAALNNWKRGYDERRYTHQPNRQQGADRNTGTANEGKAHLYAGVGRAKP